MLKHWLNTWTRKEVLSLVIVAKLVSFGITFVGNLFKHTLWARFSSGHVHHLFLETFILWDASVKLLELHWLMSLWDNCCSINLKCTYFLLNKYVFRHQRKISCSSTKRGCFDTWQFRWDCSGSKQRCLSRILCTMVTILVISLSLSLFSVIVSWFCFHAVF